MFKSMFIMSSIFSCAAVECKICGIAQLDSSDRSRRVAEPMSTCRSWVLEINNNTISDRNSPHLAAFFRLVMNLPWHLGQTGVPVVLVQRT